MRGIGQILETVVQEIHNSDLVGGNCVICEGRADNVFVTREGKREFVHTAFEENQLACQDVWRYRQARTRKESWQVWLDRNWELFEAGLIKREDYNLAEFLDAQDEYHDYHSYIRSREWKIKALRAKQLARFFCQECGRWGTPSTLEVHHKHYRTLFHEKPEDVIVLCGPCHRSKHGKVPTDSRQNLEG